MEVPMVGTTFQQVRRVIVTGDMSATTGGHRPVVYDGHAALVIIGIEKRGRVLDYVSTGALSGQYVEHGAVRVVPTPTVGTWAPTCETAEQFGERMAREDLAVLEQVAALHEQEGAVGEVVLADGQAYSPSWRALNGGARVWQCGTVDDDYMREAYDDTLDRGLSAIGAGAWWDEGMIFALVGDPDDLPESQGGDRPDDGPGTLACSQCRTLGHDRGDLDEHGRCIACRPDDERGAARDRLDASDIGPADRARDDRRAPLADRLEHAARTLLDASRHGRPWHWEDVRATLLDFAGQARTERAERDALAERLDDLDADRNALRTRLDETTSMLTRLRATIIERERELETAYNAAASIQDEHARALARMSAARARAEHHRDYFRESSHLFEIRVHSASAALEALHRAYADARPLADGEAVDACGMLLAAEHHLTAALRALED